MGATYVYRLNFFCGFIVAGGSYWALCKAWPVPATSEVWMEVGDQIEDVSMAYDAGSEYDEESAVGVKVYEEVFKGGEVNETPKSDEYRR